jgi:hypothetical protein
VNVAVARRERLPLLLFILLSLALLALARPLGWPWPVRAAAALACVFVIPGAALALLWPAAARGGWPAVAALATPLSLLPVLAAGALGRVLGWGVLPLGAAYLFGVFVVALASLVLAWRREAEETPPFWASLLFLSMVLAAVLLVAHAGAPMSPITDGPDHVATVNEILETGEFFPRQGLVPPGEVDRTDPRKGIFSIGLALAAALADVPARSIWGVAPAVLVLSWLSGLLVLGLRVGLGWPAAVLSAGLAFFFLGGAGGAWAVRLGYGAHLGMLVAWVSTGVLLELARDLQRSGVILFGVLTLIAAAVHPMAPAFVFLPALFMILLLLKDRARCLRIAGALAAALVIAAPVLIWRLSEVMGGANPLHRQTMPLLALGSRLSMMWPPEMYRSMGWPGLLGLVLVVPVSRSVGDTVGRAYLRAAAAASILFAVVPGLFDLAARLTSSLPIKLLYLNPFFFVLAALAAGSWKGRGGWSRPILAILLVLAMPGALDAFSPVRVRGWRPAGVDGALELLRTIPGREVVAADPWVSSLIAAETPHDPITVYHQHGHPLDASGLTRLNTLNAILSPSLSADDARARLRAAHARYVLVPEAEDEPLRRGFGAVAGGVLDAARAEKFSEAAPIFVLAGRAPGWQLFRAVDTGDASGRPPVWPPGLGEPRGESVASSDGTAGGVRLRTVEMPVAFTREREATLVLWWTSDGGGAGWPVAAHLKLRPLDFSGPGKANRAFGMLVRRERETRGPIRLILPPFVGAWPATSWPRATALADSQRVVLPADLRPGRYVASVRVVEEPMFERIAWRDIWSERDQWQGAWIDTVEVR